MSLKSILFAAVIVATVGAVAEVNAADRFAYGGSEGNEGQLTLNFSGGGSATLGTGFNQGWWSDVIGNSNDNTNYITGVLDFGTLLHYNNFFVFDLSDLGGTVISATLTLYSASIFNGPLTYTLWDVTTPIAELENKSNNPNTAIYTDLGSGIPYGGGYPLNDADSDQFLDFALNGNALAAINAALGGSWAIGGTVNQISAVSEPSSIAALGAALIGIGLYRRRRSET